MATTIPTGTMGTMGTMAVTVTMAVTAITVTQKIMNPKPLPYRRR
jgi:hypothetical protein